MFDPQDDPLGLGLKQRAREQRMAAWAQNPSMAPLHAALGDDWDAFFQAADEANGGRPFSFAGGTAPEALAPPSPTATAQDLENYRLMQSRQLRGKQVNPLIGPAATHGENVLRRFAPRRRSLAALENMD